MIKLFKNKSFKNLILFDFLYQISFILILVPFGKNMFSIIYKLSTHGFFYIESFKNFAISPFKIITVLILILIFSIIKLFEITGILFTLNQIKNNNTISVIEIFNNSYKILKNKFKNFKNLFIFFPIIFSIPIASFSHKKLILPNYITEYLFSINGGFLIYFIFFILRFLLSIKLIFLFHIFLLEDKNFFESLNSSFKRTKKNFFKSLKVIFTIFIKNTILEILKISLLFFIIYIFYSQTENKTLNNTTIIIYIFIATIVKIFTNIIANYISFNGISKFYFSFKNYDIKNIIYKNNKIGAKISITLIFLILISSFSKYKNSIDDIKFFHSIQNLKPIVMAHRGSTKKSPENTMESINEAIDLKAQFSEIDVRLTKDNVVVLSHDDNIKRLTKENVKISELTFNELKTKKILYDNKKFDFVDLKTVLNNTNGKIKLNIELKPIKGEEKKLAKEVSKLLENKAHNVIVSSLSIKTLKEFKNINKEIPTGLILAFAYGNFYNINFVDFFCIEEQFATTENIRKLKKKNKLIYVWTTNNKESISKTAKKGVNGIITDEVSLSKDIIKNIDFNFNELILDKILNTIK